VIFPRYPERLKDIASSLQELSDDHVGVISGGEGYSILVQATTLKLMIQGYLENRRQKEMDKEE
jgi:hypothetical protein